MASLAFGELKKYQHRIDKFLSMIDEKQPFVMVNGGAKVLQFDMTNPDAIKLAEELRKKGTSATAPKAGLKPLKDSAGNLYSLGALQKTADFGGAGENRGNVAEGILAAAIAARFVSKTKNITRQDVTAIISKLPSGESQQKSVSLKSPNNDPRVIDDVHLFIELAKTDMKNFQNKQYPDLLNASVTYVNQSNVKKWADLLYNNNVVNTINIKSMGITGARGTKVDTFVEVGANNEQPKRIDINLSLKAGDVKQFGQEAGLTWGAQERLWTNFGVKLPKQIENQYVKLQSEKKATEAFKVVFEAALNSLKNSNSASISKAVADAIVYYATLREQDVDLLQLKGNKAVLYRFSDAVKLLQQVEIGFELKYGGSSLPTLIFNRKVDSEPLVKIRVKKSGTGYFRTIVEKERLMEDILAVKYE